MRSSDWSSDVCSSDLPEISAAELFEELRPQLVQNRAFMNVDGGYWVLGLQMEAIERADRAELPAGDWAIALASDGFLRLADMFAHLGASDLLSIENRAEFEKCYSDLQIGRASYRERVCQDV